MVVLSVPILKGIPMQFVQGIVCKFTDMLLCRHIDTPVRKGFGGHAFLDQFADFPVLAVDEFKDLHGIRWVKICSAHYLGVEKPIAGHTGEFWPQRLEAINDHMVAQQVQVKKSRRFSCKYI